MATPESNSLLLRDVSAVDLPIFFEYERDPDWSYMAAFTAKDPTDREAFNTHWAKILSDPNNVNRTIVVDGVVVGNIASFEMFGERNVSYSIGKAYWGHGYATQALTLFLQQISLRPLYGRAVKDNFGSRRVLEKCGFANARGQEVDELILMLS